MDRAGQLVVCDRLIGGTGQVIDAANAVLVIDGKISAVGEANALARASAAVVDRLEYPGCSLLPGLVNANDHVAFRRSRLNLGDHFARDDDYQALFMVRSLALALAEGVTLTRDMGAVGQRSLHARRAVASNTVPGPDVLTCANGITRPGGPGSVISLQVQGPAEARQAAQTQLSRGADFLKVFASSDGSSENPPVLSADELKAIVEVARSEGQLVVAHATTAESIRSCLEAGVRCVEHGPGLTPELAAELADAGGWFVPTLSGFAVIADEGSNWGRPPGVVRRFVEMVKLHKGAVGNALETGVKLAAGTDSLGTMAMEAALLSEAGLSPQEVIRAATLNGAELLGLDGQVGDLRVGMHANLLVVRGNPLDNLASLAEPQVVFKRGVAHGIEAIRRLFPAPNRENS